MSETAKHFEKIVVRIPNWVGDAVMATAALRSIRRGFPGARIFLYGKSKLLELLDGLEGCDETIPLRSGSKSGGVWSEAAALRPHRFDMGLLLPNSFSSALVFFLGGVRNRTGYGMNGRSLLLNRTIPISARARKKNPEPMTGYYLRLARFAGGARTGEELELAVDPEGEAAASVFLAEKELEGARPLVGLNAGSSYGPSKCWTPEGFARLSDAIHDELGGRTVLLCGPGEEEIARQIVDRARRPIIDTSRKVLPFSVLKSVMGRLHLLVTTDTGPRHIAVAFGIPVVVLMGPTNPNYTASNLDRTRVVRLDLECAPCHKKECDRDHDCMRAITADDVLARARELLSLPQAAVAGKGECHGQ